MNIDIGICLTLIQKSYCWEYHLQIKAIDILLVNAFDWGKWPPFFLIQLSNDKVIDQSNYQVFF